MHIKIVPGKCAGHARCAAVAPDIFPLDDDGYIALETLQVSEADAALTRRGAAACPERAIDVVED